MTPAKSRSIADWPLRSQYALALSTIVLALAVRYLLSPAFGTRFPFFPIFLVLLPLAFVVRSGPFLAAALLGAFASMYFFLAPVRTWRLHETDLLQVGLFFASLATLVLTAWLSRRTQHKLRRADAMLRAFVDESPSPKWVTNQDGRIVYANGAMAAALGSSLGDIIGRGQPEVLPFCDGPAGAGEFRPSKRDGHGDEEQPRRFEWRRFPLHIGNSHALIGGIATDVTEEYKYAAALRARESELEAVINLTPFMMTRCSRDLRYRFVSLTYARMIGRSQADVIGQPIADIVGSAGLKTLMPYIERVLRGEVVEYEDAVNFKGVGSRVLSAVYTPDRDESGEVIGWVASMVDLTEMRKNQAELAAAVKERERLLDSERAARIEAEQATRVKDEFLATLSHELRTPLNAILGWIRLIEKDPNDSKMLHDGIPIIARNAKVQMDLIADLLDTSRIISGKIRLDLKPLHVADLVADSVETIRPIAESKLIEVTRSIERFNEPVLGDENRLQQVVWNLLTNAVKFTPSGGRIDVRVERNGPSARVVVSDTGEGINAAFLPHLFERFRQADASTSRRFVGLGLGLAIVKHLVGLHGGTVRAHSDGEGRGSTFTVELPLADTAADGNLLSVKSGPAYVPEVVDLSGVTVLAVEDHADALDLLKRVLEDRHARVLTAESADDALVLMRAQRPDIVISDIAMPGKDGYQLIRELRDADDDTPAIAVTAFARTEDVKRALDAGYQAHVSKPVDEDALVAAVSTWARCRVHPDSRRATTG